MSSLVKLSAQEIINWVTTADGCIHIADTTQLDSRRVGGVYWASVGIEPDVFSTP